MAPGDILKLNIGGTVFQTTVATLTKFDGFFKAMLEIDIPLKKDENGCVFVDRSPRHFDYVLNYMRDGNVVLPVCRRERQQLLQEARYYLLDGLIELCTDRVRMVNEYDNIREIHGDNPKKAVIVGYHPGLWGDLNECVFARKLVKAFHEHYTFYFKPITENFSYCDIDVYGVAARLESRLPANAGEIFFNKFNFFQMAHQSVNRHLSIGQMPDVVDGEKKPDQRIYLCI
ncbi:hypothetical protein CRE_09623 [Caenorhabditis remanei]|uniref:BTB domain-containing protein n=1 Tax=Caenorhabditis remanei TaxID=31234 RepID=E3MJ06_CAERE|nr:hypothetical protein CRE_09623 [Caenorhabditis remanei]